MPSWKTIMKKNASKASAYHSAKADVVASDTGLHLLYLSTPGPLALVARWSGRWRRAVGLHAWRAAVHSKGSHHAADAQQPQAARNHVRIIYM